MSKEYVATIKSRHDDAARRARVGLARALPAGGEKGTQTRSRWVSLFFGILLLGLASTPSSASNALRQLDSFDNLAPWKALASDGVSASAHSVEGVEGRALRLDFDFGGVAGYAFARRALALDLPENYEITFHVRADAPVNTFEIKLADASGDNVWWSQHRDFTFPSEWRRMKIKKRQIAFAWGPAKDHTLRRADSLEFVVTAGRDGGRGSVEIDQLSIRELPPEPTRFPMPAAEATSFLAGAEPGRAVDGRRDTAWRSGADSGSRQSLTVDLGLTREFGGLDLVWANNAFASRYDVSVSGDGAEWQVLRRVTAGNGGSDPLALPEAEGRFVRLDLHDGSQGGVELAEMQIRDLAFGASPNAFIERVAQDAPRGHYPRGFSGEQPYWTIVGVDGGGESGLLSEDGAVEVARGGISIEPFILSGSEIVTWADVEIGHSLEDGYLPIPSVTWRHRNWDMQVTAFAAGSPADARLLARYTVTNRTGEPQSLKLALAPRPFQVNPPTQSLNIAGGVSPIRSLKWNGGKLWVNGEAKIAPLSTPSSVAMSPFDSGSYPGKLVAPSGQGAHEVADETGLASGALIYELNLAPHATATVGLAAPLAGAMTAPDLEGQSPEAWVGRKHQEVADAWRAKLNLVSFEVPGHAGRVVDTLRSSLAHILMTRNGPILQPGTRSYNRSWIRDGAMISESLVRLGHANIAADYLRWFAPHQFANGKVPCCVDKRGADPVPENDSHGQLIFLAAEVYRYTGDRSLLDAVWPQVEAATRYMDTLRASERTEANLTPERRMLYGLLPPSISHEGYAAKPAYSYWDGFWGLLGYKDAVVIATALGKSEAASHLTRQHDEFRRDLYASLRSAAEVHGIPYLPGAADLGDFDATSTTIALAPGGERHHLPDDLLLGTFERYWRNFTERRDGLKAWHDYTPYELRIVSTFVRLGWRDRAHELLDFFFKDQRPNPWNQWAEVVGREPRQPRFIGDMPHAWISSDYIRSALALFVYEREVDQALVLGAGIPDSWLEGEGIAVNNLRTPFGFLSYSLRAEGPRRILKISGDAKPPGGFILPSFEGDGALSARLGGAPMSTRSHELHVASAPTAEIMIEPLVTGSTSER